MTMMMMMIITTSIIEMVDAAQVQMLTSVPARKKERNYERANMYFKIPEVGWCCILLSGEPAGRGSHGGSSCQVDEGDGRWLSVTALGTGSRRTCGCSTFWKKWETLTRNFTLERQ